MPGTGLSIYINVSICINMNKYKCKYKLYIYIVSEQPPGKDYYYSHFSDEETEAQRL